MKRWHAVVGVGVLVVLAWMALQGVAQYQPPPAVTESRPLGQQGYYQPQPGPGQWHTPPAPTQPPAPTYPPPVSVAPAVQPSPSSKPFLEVGKRYTFVMATGKNEDLEKCKVVELLRDGWVKVKVKDGDSFVSVWINLKQVAFVHQGDSSRKASRACCVTSE